LGENKKPLSGQKKIEPTLNGKFTYKKSEGREKNDSRKEAIITEKRRGDRSLWG